MPTFHFYLSSGYLLHSIFWDLFSSGEFPKACDLVVLRSHAFHCLQFLVMTLPWRGWLDTSCNSHPTNIFRSRWILLFSMIWLAIANAMTPARIAELRKETVDMFYHGFDNYMAVAFPEDEVRLHDRPRGVGF
jgi:hypothetical protein